MQIIQKQSCLKAQKKASLKLALHLLYSALLAFWLAAESDSTVAFVALSVAEGEVLSQPAATDIPKAQTINKEITILRIYTPYIS